MEKDVDRIDLLADLLERSLRVFITEPPAPSRRRKKTSLENVFSTPEQRRLAGLLGEEWDQIMDLDGHAGTEGPHSRVRGGQIVDSLFRSCGRREAARLAVRLLETRGRWFFCRFPDDILDWRVRRTPGYDDRLPDCPAIARRVATHLAAVDAPPVEAVVVDLSGHLPRISLGQGWTLASFDDQLMPIEIPEIHRELEHLHRGRRLAIVSRPERPDAPLHDPAADRSLSWPLTVLNLAIEQPVRALVAYRMIPGGAILPVEAATTASGTFVPAEIGRWDPRPDHITPRTLPPLNDDQRRTVAGLAQALDAAVNRGHLQDWQLAQFWHAVDRLLSVTYHAHDRQLPEGEYELLPFMEPAEATVQLVAALEGLFDDEGSHTDVTRRLAQRVALLASVDDAERLTIRNKVNRYYRIRSDRAHGSAKPAKEVDLADLRNLVRSAIVGWSALAPVFNARRAMAVALDDAIISPGTSGQEIDRLLTAFRDHHRKVVVIEK